MGRKRLKPDFDRSKLSENPFLDYFRIYSIRSSSSSELFEKDLGVVVSVDSKASITTIKKHDIEHYFKGYNKSANRLKVCSLNAKAKELLWFICFELKPTMDYVIVNTKRYFKENKTCYKTYRSSVLQLIKVDIIAETGVSNVFYINPSFIFNGNRINRFPDNVIELDVNQEEIS